MNLDIIYDVLFLLGVFSAFALLIESYRLRDRNNKEDK